MKILSVDYGDKRTGIAVCDKNMILASPLCTIETGDREKLIDDITEIINKENIELIVVGLPKNMDGSEGFRAQECTEFADFLSEKSGIKCVMHDERLTTVSAHNYLSAVNKRGKARKSVVDRVSAVIILQDYIDSLKNKG